MRQLVPAKRALDSTLRNPGTTPHSVTDTERNRVKSPKFPKI